MIENLCGEHDQKMCLANMVRQDPKIDCIWRMNEQMEWTNFLHVDTDSQKLKAVR